MKVTLTITAEFPDEFESELGFVDGDSGEPLPMDRGFQEMYAKTSNTRAYVDNALEFLDYIGQCADDNTAYFDLFVDTEVEGGNMH